MLSKISSMLDAVANSLEAKGLIKEAYEIDKIADVIESSQFLPGLSYGGRSLNVYHEKRDIIGPLIAQLENGDNLGYLPDSYIETLIENAYYDKHPYKYDFTVELGKKELKERIKKYEHNDKYTDLFKKIDNYKK